MMDRLHRLDEWRRGCAGTVLFYSYLVAILIGAVVMAVAIGNITDNAHDIKKQTERLAAFDVRSCAAISAASRYWQRSREVVRDRLADPEITDAARAADLRYVAALNDVITSTDIRSCRRAP